MDSITQALLGATIAKAGFRKRLGRKAVAFGAFLGAAPDLDVFTRLAGEWASLVHHRGVTHSLLVLPLLAPLMGGLGARWWGKKSDRLVWMHLAFWALLSHPFLDVFTTYGTQLLAPFSDRRFAADGIAIIDPIYSLPLLVAVVVNRRWVAWIALLFTTAYLATGVSVSQIAQSAARAQFQADGFEPVAMRSPVPIAFPLLRRVVARDESGEIRVGAWSPFVDQIRFTRLAPSSHRMAKAALAREEGQLFSWFADGFVHAVVGDEGVELIDQRYGFYVDPTRGPFRALVRFEGDRVVSVRQMRRPQVNFKEELSTAWRIMWGR